MGTCNNTNDLIIKLISNKTYFLVYVITRSWQDFVDTFKKKPDKYATYCTMLVQ
jgi:hypothetical protein